MVGQFNMSLGWQDKKIPPKPRTAKSADPLGSAGVWDPCFSLAPPVVLPMGPQISHLSPTPPVAGFPQVCQMPLGPASEGKNVSFWEIKSPCGRAQPEHSTFKRYFVCF